MSGNSPGFSGVPETGADEKEHRRRLAKGINGLLAGKMNAVTTVTLAAGVATTTLTDARITINSFIGLMPTTANAATALATTYISNRMSSNGNVAGNATITHANNAQTDRTFTVLIIG
jgi:hypothetical protein